MKFSIFMPFRNATPWLVQSFQSVKCQTFTDWECFVIDDASTDGGFEVAQKECDGDSRFILTRNEERKWKLTNFLETYPKMQGEIVIEKDGDDWFSRDDALAIINAEYESDEEVDATIGSYVRLPDKQPNPVPPNTWKFQQGTRMDHAWAYHAPRTFRRELLSKIDTDCWMWKRRNNSVVRVYTLSADVAIFSPIAHLARKIAHVNECIYVVNDYAPNRDHKESGVLAQFEQSTMMHNWWIRHEKQCKGECFSRSI